MNFNNIEEATNQPINQPTQKSVDQNMFLISELPYIINGVIKKTKQPNIELIAHVPHLHEKARQFWVDLERFKDASNDLEISCLNLHLAWLKSK